MLVLLHEFDLWIKLYAEQGNIYQNQITQEEYMFGGKLDEGGEILFKYLFGKENFRLGLNHWDLKYLLNLENWEKDHLEFAKFYKINPLEPKEKFSVLGLSIEVPEKQRNFVKHMNSSKSPFELGSCLRF